MRHAVTLTVVLGALAGGCTDSSSLPAPRGEGGSGDLTSTSTTTSNPTSTTTSNPTSTSTTNPTSTSNPTSTTNSTSNPTSTTNPTSTSTSDPTSNAVPDAGAPDAATASPRPAPVTAAIAVFAGQDLPLARQGVTAIDPAATFRVEVATHLADGRLSLLDEADAMVVSTGTTELGASLTRYRLAPAEPLRPGSRYHLRLEGAVTREAHDAAGRAYGPVVHELATTGERPAAPARKRGKRRP